MVNVRLYTDQQIESERPDLAEAAMQGVFDVTAVQRVDGQITKYEDPGTLAHITKAVSDSYDPRRRQVFADGVLLNFVNNTHMRDFSEHDFTLITPDIYTEHTNFVFGITVAPWRMTLQSVDRFVKATRDENMQRAAVRHIARHEFGHMRGMNAPEDYVNPLRGNDAAGLYDGHCADLCTMQQVMSASEALSLVDRLPQDEAGFCVSCVTTLIKKAH